MFDIGWSELVVIAVVALIAIGPKELPGVLRMVGNYMGKIRRMASEFQGQFQEAMREAEIDQLKKDMDDMAAKATDYTQFDPMASVRKEVESFTTDPLGNMTSTASPEAVDPTVPAPVSPEATIPQPASTSVSLQADLAIAAEAPQPQTEAVKEVKAGSGA